MLVRPVGFFGGPRGATRFGYTSGGTTGTATNRVDKFPFPTDANSTDVLNLSVSRYESAGNSSLSHGYTNCGWTTVRVNVIDKFPFATDTNATDVGDLTLSRTRPCGQQY